MSLTAEQQATAQIIKRKMLWADAKTPYGLSYEQFLDAHRKAYPELASASASEVWDWVAADNITNMEFWAALGFSAKKTQEIWDRILKDHMEDVKRILKDLMEESKRRMQ